MKMTNYVFITVFGVMYTEAEVRESVLVFVEQENDLYQEVYLRVPGREDREIATVFSTAESLRLRSELVMAKGQVWSRNK